MYGAFFLNKYTIYDIYSTPIRIKRSVHIVIIKNSISKYTYYAQVKIFSPVLIPKAASEILLASIYLIIIR